MGERITKHSLQDTGQRTQYETGAVRETGAKKGRMDLFPVNVLATLLRLQAVTPKYTGSPNYVAADILMCIDNFIYGQNVLSIYMAILFFIDIYYDNIVTAVIDVSRQFEDGALKYSDRNWEKGLPLHVYVDSGVRHLLKSLRNDTDENHNAAFLWNMICLIETYLRFPGLNDLPKETPNRIAIDIPTE